MKITTATGTILVAAIGLAGVLGWDARAKTTEELIADLGICYNGCSTSSQTCNRSCCRIIFCSKSCILSCDSQLNGCKSGCNTDILGAETDGAFFDTGTVDHTGHTVRVGGPLFCAEGGTADVAVTLTQSGTGAVATGHVRQECRADETSFTVVAHAVGGTAFEALTSVQACGSARIHAPGQGSVDAFQWCRAITPLSGGVQLGD